MKLDIRIVVRFEDEDGSEGFVSRESKSFESAEEDLGKLQRYIEEKEKKELTN